MSLSVSDLPVHCTDDELGSLFRPFGLMSSAKLVRHGATASAVVVFVDRESAEMAKLHVDGRVYVGRRLRVEWSDAHAVNSLYVRFSSRKGECVSSEDLFHFFTPYGYVTEVSLMDATVDPRTGRQSGLAFVHYDSSPEGLQCALRAVQALDGHTVDGVHFKVEPSKHFNKHCKQQTSAASGLFGAPRIGNVQQQASGHHLPRPAAQGQRHGRGQGQARLSDTRYVQRYPSPVSDESRGDSLSSDQDFDLGWAPKPVMDWLGRPLAAHAAAPVHTQVAPTYAARYALNYAPTGPAYNSAMPTGYERPLHAHLSLHHQETGRMGGYFY